MPHVRSMLETCLDVDDLDRARTFYTTLFDLPVLAADSRFCAMAISNENVLILFKRDESLQPIRVPGGVIPPHGSHGPVHFAFGIDLDRLEWWRRRLAEYCIPVYSEVRWPLGGISLYFHDPDGHVAELATPGVWDFTKLS